MEKSVETGRAFIFNKNTFVLHLLFGRDGFSHCGLMAWLQLDQNGWGPFGDVLRIDLLINTEISHKSV